MGCSCFDKQRFDKAGVLAVRLQKLLITMFILSLIPFACTIHEMVQVHRVHFFPLFVFAIVWGVWFLGFRGARKRSTCRLMAYWILTFIGAVVEIVGFFWVSVGGSVAVILTLDQCAKDPSCPEQSKANEELQKYPYILLSMFAVSFLFFLLPFVLNVLGLALAWNIRKELNVIKKGQQAAIEEGAMMNSPDFKLEQFATDNKQEQQQQQQQPTMFYAAPDNPHIQQGYFPVNSYHPGSGGMVVMIPAPMQQGGSIQ